MRDLCIATLCALGVAGCATTRSIEPGWDAADEAVRASTGATTLARPDRPDQPREELEAVLAGGLSLDEAMALALRRDPRLLAGFHAVGVAQAEYAQAGLLDNPVLGLSLLVPDGGGRAKLAADISQPLTAVWRLPGRRRQAQAALDSAITDLSLAAHALLVQTRGAWTELALARAAVELVAEHVEVAQLAAKAADNLAAAGAADALTVANARSSAAALELRLAGSRAHAREAGRRLALLLQLDGELAGVAVLLPAPADADASDVATLQSIAGLRRVDLRASAGSVAQAMADLALAKGERAPQVSAGLGYERPETEGAAVLGPEASIELPLFHRNEARIAVAEQELLRRQVLHAALEAQVRREVEAAASRAAEAAATAATASSTIVPEAARTLELADKAVRLGSATPLDLYAARRTLLEARTAELEARAGALRARLGLEEAVGGPLLAAAPVQNP